MTDQWSLIVVSLHIIKWLHTSLALAEFCREDHMGAALLEAVSLALKHYQLKSGASGQTAAVL